MDVNNGALDVAGWLVDVGTNLYNSERNYEQQLKAYNEQKRLNDSNIDWQHNKYYYSSIDLSNAGLSKAAFLGSNPSNAVALSSGNAAQANSVTNFGGIVSKYLDNMNKVAQRSVLENTATKAEAETSYIKVQEALSKEKVITERLEQKIKETSNEKLKQDLKNAKLEFDKLFHNLKLSKQGNIRTNDVVHTLYNTLKQGSGDFLQSVTDSAVDVLSVFWSDAVKFRERPYRDNLRDFLDFAKDKTSSFFYQSFDKIIDAFNKFRKRR
nr:MAG: hypothetical protein [Microvirus sp.]